MPLSTAKLTVSHRSPRFIDCVPRAPRAGTHPRAWRPRWVSGRWWAWLDSSCPRPWRPLRKRRHLGGGGGIHSLAQSFIPRTVATGLSAQGRPLGSQNEAKCSTHEADRGDGCHRKELCSLQSKDLPPPEHHPQPGSTDAPEVETDQRSLPELMAHITGSKINLKGRERLEGNEKRGYS